MDLQDKVAIVTGAGTGIGQAVAWRLSEEGCHVAAVGRRLEKLHDTASGCRGPGKILTHTADVGDRRQVDELTRAVLAEIGPADILVNNAGVNIRKRRIAELSLDDWDNLVRINLTGAFLMIHAILPQMRDRHSGLIVNVSSIAGVRPSVLGGAAYSAGKSGLGALSTVLALEEGRNGIKSTLICPGEVETPILDERPEPVSPERRATMLQPKDVADAIAFVAKLPSRAHIPLLVVTPTVQPFA